MADEIELDLSDAKYSMCVALSGLSGLAAGALSTLGNPIGIVLGGVAGVLIGSKVCKPNPNNNPVMRGRDVISSAGELPEYLTADEFDAFKRRLTMYGIKSDDDARFLARQAAAYVQQGGRPGELPSHPEMSIGLAQVLKQRPRT